MLRTRCLAAGMAVALAACQALAVRTQVKPGFNLFSKQQEIQLGREVAAEANKKLTLVRDPQLEGYVRQLGLRLARYSPAPDYPYSFQVVKEKSINAFALPGGPVYLHTGTIAAADNEAQLAGVMAHEIAHVALRHATNNASRAMLAQMPLAILGGAIGSGSVVGQLAQLGISFGVNSVFLKYSRDAERQADIVGAQIMYDAGYDPEEMARFFEKLQRTERSRSIEFLSDHPNPGNRIELVRSEVQKLGPQKYQLESGSGFQQAGQAAQRLSQQVAAPAPADFGHESAGQHQHPAYPSRNLRVFDGGSYRISYPDNWNVYGQETSAVTIAPREGIVQSGNTTGLAYGAMVSLYEPDLGGAQAGLEEATTQLVDQLQRSNPGLRSLNRRQRIQLDNRPAVSLTLLGRSPVRGENEMDWLVTALRPDGTLWYVVFVAPERDFSSLRPVFLQMLDSVRLNW